MAKLYFKYGAMGSSKTAQALITKYNYEENDMSVWLLKPSTDTRDGAATVHSRIGLEATAQIASPDTDVYQLLRSTRADHCHVVIVDCLGTLSHIFFIQGSKLCSFFEALSEMKSPWVHQLIQLLSRSSITLAHISLTEASCLLPMALVE